MLFLLALPSHKTGTIPFLVYQACYTGDSPQKPFVILIRLPDNSAMLCNRSERRQVPAFSKGVGSVITAWKNAMLMSER